MVNKYGEVDSEEEQYPRFHNLVPFFDQVLMACLCLNIVLPMPAELVESKVLDVEDNFNCEEAQLSLSYRVSLSVESKARRGLNQGQYFGVSESTSILDNVSGICELGQMLAVMGPSGAGKTSLLNCLSLRNTRFRGYVLHSGEPPDLDSLAVNTVFVQQEELFIGQVTPREHLTFNATLRASKPMSKNQRREIVNKSLEEMGLGESVRFILVLVIFITVIVIYSSIPNYM
ncbi:unnamed protein product [Discosporangium mesarthrocarpum]